MKKILVIIILAMALAVSAHADFNTGFDAYLKGDFDTAFKELSPAAGQGDPKAQFALGLLYQLGKGVEQDNVQAFKWYGLAEAQGHKKAPKNKAGVAKQMSPKEIQKAESLIAQFKPSTAPAPVVEAQQPASIQQAIQEEAKAPVAPPAKEVPKPAELQPELVPQKAAQTVNKELKTPESAQTPSAPQPITQEKTATTTAEPLPTQATAAMETKKPTVSFWHGTMTCGSDQGDQIFRLTPSSRKGEVLDGVLHIYPSKKSFNKGYSALEMKGTLDSGTGQFQLKPGKWINKPRDPKPINLEGVFSSDNKTVQGSVKGAGCSEFTGRLFEITLPPPNPKGLLFKAAADTNSLAEDDCIAFLKWLNAGEQMGRNLHSQLLDDERMRKVFGKSFFQWESKDSVLYLNIRKHCSNMAKNTINLELSEERSKIKYWDVRPLVFDREGKKAGGFWFPVEQDYIAAKEAVTLAAEQKAMAKGLPAELKSLDVLKSLIKENSGGDNPLAWLTKDEKDAQQAFLKKRQEEIAGGLVNDSLKKFASCDDSEAGISRLEALFKETKNALWPHIPESEASRLHQAYFNELLKKERALVAPRLREKISALGALKKSDIDQSGKLMEIKNEAMKIKLLYIPSNQEAKKAAEDFDRAYEETWIAMVNNSIKLVDSKLKKVPTHRERIAAVDAIAMKVFGTKVEDIPDKHGGFKSMLISKRKEAEEAEKKSASSEPSESDIERAIKAQDRLGVIRKVHNLGCIKNKDGRGYNCDVELEKKALGATQKEVLALRFVYGSDGWMVVTPGK